MGSRLQPQRIAGGFNDEAKEQATDKNFDDIFQYANKQNTRLTRIESMVSGVGGPIDLTAIYLLIQKVEDESREFALMMRYRV